MSVRAKLNEAMGNRDESNGRRVLAEGDLSQMTFIDLNAALSAPAPAASHHGVTTYTHLQTHLGGAIATPPTAPPTPTAAIP